MSPARGSDPEPTNRRILIVDDNEAIHADFLKVLGDTSGTAASLNKAAESLFQEPEKPARISFQVSGALQGQEGVALAERALLEKMPFAMAFVDMRMPPGWDGLETIRQLWEIDPQIQVVICTAYSDYSWEEVVDRLAPADRLLVLKKPFDNIEVRQLAFALTEKWNLARRARQTHDSLQQMVNERTRELSLSNEQLKHEIEERRRSEAAIREANARTQSVFDTAPDGIITINASGVIESVNEAAGQMFGFAPQEMLGQYVTTLMREEDARLHNAAISRRIAGRQRLVSRSERLLGRRRGGELFPVEVSFSGVCVGDRWIFTGIIRDITQQLKIEAQLQQTQKLESIGQLAAGIAHEINTPIHFVAHNVEFLGSAYERISKLFKLCAKLKSREATAEQIQTAHEQLENSGILLEIQPAIQQSLEGLERVAGIVRAMKEFSHPGTSSKVMANLNRMIDIALKVAHNETKYVADVVTDYDPSVTLVPCHPGEMSQVFLNLIVNAAHAIGDRLRKEGGRGRLTVSTRHCGRWIEIAFKDTGSGIPEELRGRIFDPFFTTKEVGKGTGQGLPIVHHIVVEKHHGEVDFTSQVGSGTTFTVRIPSTEMGQPLPIAAVELPSALGEVGPSVGQP